MKITIALIALACLAGCSSSQVKPFLDNLDRDCVRHYAGSVGGTLGQATVTFQIDCQPAKTAAPAQ